jgi:predicted GTPase
MSPERTMLRAPVPIVAVTAVRTGCGKSPASRYVAKVLREAGHRVAVVRHPMPYGDLARQAVQRFETLADLAAADCTFEEREEYEAHIEEGSVVFAGVDFAAILARAAQEADVVLWDGGNNDVPFYRPDLWITLVDPLRPGHETRFHPGEINLRRADVIVVPKADVAKPEDIAAVEAAAMAINPAAHLIRAASPLTVDVPHAVTGKRVLCVEDGPTTTHGGMGRGAAWQAAKALGAAEIVDPRPSLRGSLRGVFEAYPHLRQVLPAMGYFPQQIADLQSTIAATDCDLVLIGTPIDLTRLLDVPQPTQRVRYTFAPESDTLKERVLAAVALAVAK